MVVRNDFLELEVFPVFRVKGALYLLGFCGGRGFFEVVVSTCADGPRADEVQRKVGWFFLGCGRGEAAALEEVRAAFCTLRGHAYEGAGGGGEERAEEGHGGCSSQEVASLATGRCDY